MSNTPYVIVTVRLYSILRRRGDKMTSTIYLQVSDGAPLAHVLELLELPRDLDLVLAINGEISSIECTLRARDHIDIIPAVAGG